MNPSNSAAGLATRLLHGARDLVWQDDPRSVKVNPAAPSAATARPSGEVQPPAGNAALPASAAPSAIASELLTLVLSRPTAYSAMSEAITALNGLGMDEATRYRAAFAVLKKTQQRTVEQIAQAIDVHLGLLQAERERFASQSRAAESDQITTRRATIVRLNSEVNAAGEAMTQLRRDTEVRLQAMQATQVQKQTEATALARQVEAEQHNIERTTREFATAASSIEQFLQQERTRLHEALGSAA